MNEFKFRFVNVLFFALLLGSSYWAFQKMNPHFRYTADDVVATEEDGKVNGFDHYNVSEEEEFIQNENSEQTDIQDEKSDSVSDQTESKEKEDSSQSQEKNSPQFDEEHQFLLTKLQGLIDDDIYMKKGSHGTRVGTVQKFLNLYFDKQIRVDNEYGPNTMYLVRKFQQKEGLSPDGLAGPDTYRKMIELIKEGKV